MKYCPACHRTYPTEYNVCPGDQSSLQSAHELQPGMVIRNKYEILERIGIGGMGFVYRGRHMTFNELCAIKIVNDAIAGDSNFLQRFQTEAVVARKLRHPNAVRVEDYDYTEDGRPFIVMELVEGKNVGEALQEQGPMHPARAIRIATQVARALGTAHKLGIVHRDIKPGNILLATDENGQETAKVLDFGIAKLREAAGKAGMTMTMTGMVVGTPLYMSPEQFMGKKEGGEIDGRTDLYSLGVVLYQMVTARLPFEGDTLYSLMMQHMEGNVRPPHELTPELQIPAALSVVILKSIDKSRDLRYQTADEFIAALEQLPIETAGSFPAAGSPVAAPPKAPTPTAQRSTVQTPPPARTVAIPPPTGVAPNVPVTPPSRATPIPTTPAPSASSVATPRPTTPPPSFAHVPPPATPPPAIARTQASAPAPTQPDSVLVKSAEQHILLQPKKAGARTFIIVLVLLIAAAVVGTVGYLKYQDMRRVRIENTVTEKLSSAPSESLHSVRVAVSAKREVTLDGKVASMQDFAMATTLAASVDGVTFVNNRLAIAETKPTQTQNQGGAQTESPQALIDKGTAYLDTGEYQSAIDCFARAADDPATKDKAQQLLERAQRAQATEEKLLKNRR